MLPPHLQRYVIEQDYAAYTPVQHEIWRYIVLQLRSFLTQHAHPCYLEGLTKTGVFTDCIPNIEKMDICLQKFGWRAAAVSGFIPPAAFMELQSLGYLPIATNLRTLKHIHYTPAPDIVHEAAGHAPILVNPEFARYLKAYAQVATKAIISKEDLDIYKAIRDLSDIKEDPQASGSLIKAAQERLEAAQQRLSHVSEAALLGRMNWWTAEYGLIGSLNNPKIYGAGLLSSVGEARSCLHPSVKKIPFSIECIEYDYDITEPQPQLFVTPDFETLLEVLKELEDRLAFKKGGIFGLETAIKASSITTVVLDSGLQVSGVVDTYTAKGDRIDWITWIGPCQISQNFIEISGYGTSNFPEGLFTPLGCLKGFDRPIHRTKPSDLRLEKNKTFCLDWHSDFSIKGSIRDFITDNNGYLLCLVFERPQIKRGNECWQSYEKNSLTIIGGEKVTQVLGNSADRERFGISEDFVAKFTPQPTADTAEKKSIFQDLRTLRQKIEYGQALPQNLEKEFIEAVGRLHLATPNEWLPALGFYELSQRYFPHHSANLREYLESLQSLNVENAQFIEDGFAVIAEIH